MPELVAQIFCPFSTQWSPSRAARVRILPPCMAGFSMSHPPPPAGPPGSVMLKQPILSSSPQKMGPKWSKTASLPAQTAGRKGQRQQARTTAIPESPRAFSSALTDMVTAERWPVPPYFLGKMDFMKPILA